MYEDEEFADMIIYTTIIGFVRGKSRNQRSFFQQIAKILSNVITLEHTVVILRACLSSEEIMPVIYEKQIYNYIVMVMLCFKEI